MADFMPHQRSYSNSPAAPLIRAVLQQPTATPLSSYPSLPARMICFQLALLEALGLRLCLPQIGGADDGSATALALSESADAIRSGVIPAPAPPQSCTLLAPSSAGAVAEGPPIPPRRRPGQLLLPESPHFFTDQPVYASTIDDSSQHCAAVEDQDGSITALRGDLIISHSNATELHLPKLRVVTGARISETSCAGRGGICAAAGINLIVRHAGCISIFDNALLETISLPRYVFEQRAAPLFSLALQGVCNRRLANVTPAAAITRIHQS
jgi:hypothetical protein